MIENIKKQFTGKNILVVGLGLQGGGVGLVRFLCKLGAKVTVTDLKSKDLLQPSIDKLKEFSITYSLGEHKLEDFINADIIFKGPSVPWNLPVLVEAQKKGIPIEMETAFFVANTLATVVGITGTRGKSTTTQMIYEALKQGERKVYLSGNIPNSSSIELLETVKKEDIVVLELSSWQLSGFHKKKVSPHIAVFTNLYPDHLNFYKSMEEYLYDKKAIYLYQKSEDYLIINESMKPLVKDDQVKSQIHYFNATDFPDNLFHPRGVHNQENAAAAFIVTKIVCANYLKAVNIIKNFPGLPFRQQIIRMIDKVTFINDSTSTTPVATVKAVETFSSEPIILILGGNTKGLPINLLIESLESVQNIFLLKGTMTDEILGILKDKYSDKISSIYDNFDQAVKDAYKKAQDLKQACYVLLSPGATSFAMFKNEFHRGEEFNRIVMEI